MSQAYPYDQYGEPIAIRAEESARAAFIRRTYTHLAGAVLAFVALEWVFFTFVISENFGLVFFSSPWMFLLLLGAFIGGGMVARWWAYNGSSPAMAYTGLTLYVILQAVFFIPILWFTIYGVQRINPAANPADILGQAGVLTLALFGGLTMVAVTTGKNFSFLGPILCTGSFLLFGVCIAGALFGFGMGLWICFAAVALACGGILYATSNVLHRFRTNQHVAAALELFASVAYLFYNVLWILLSLANSRD
ncbi:MAG: US12 family protein [Planctomycetes bacterium]|nr:US12 family protein [Planctomycetota bacterium]